LIVVVAVIERVPVPIVGVNAAIVMVVIESMPLSPARPVAEGPWLFSSRERALCVQLTLARQSETLQSINSFGWA
jgi:hypothetical protein